MHRTRYARLVAPLLRHLAAALFLILLLGCAGSGCGGCSSCGGLEPLPGGFQPGKRIENAGSARLTNSGLQFLQNNVGTLAQAVLGTGTGGVITFPIPETQGSVNVVLGSVDYDINAGGPDPNANPPRGIVEADLANANLQISTGSPHDIHVTGTVPVRLRNLPVHATYGCACVPFIGCGCILDITPVITLSGNGSCPDGNTFANVGLDIDVSVEIDNDPSHARYGYSKVVLNGVTIDSNDLSNSITFCNAGLASDLLNALKGLVVPLVAGPLESQLQSAVSDQLCQKSDPTQNPPCPTGTSDVSGTCRYGTSGSDQCVSIMLGTDGHANLGGLLASISPGTKGGLDFLLAAGGQDTSTDDPPNHWGDLDPVNGGATLGLFGGAEPNPVSKCVKQSKLALPTGIPIPDELFGNTVPNWPAATPGPHVGLALSERFTNYALSGIYNSGLLCLGISTENQALLNSSTLALAVQGLTDTSLLDLGIQHSQQQAAVVIRPTKPPTATFGNGTDIATDPTMRVKLDQAAIDFYMFSDDRFIRFMTLTMDLDVPVNLQVSPAGLEPQIGAIVTKNASVTNSALLAQDPATIATNLSSLIGGLVGQFTGNIAPVDLNASLASLGLALVIPDTVPGQGSPGIVKLTKGSDNYLGIFASLGIAQPAAFSLTTHAHLASRQVDPAGLHLTTMTPGNAPIARINVSADAPEGGQEIEYQYKVDEGGWKPFQRTSRLDVTDDWLRIQGRHTIWVRSRIVGQPMSLDRAPVAVELVVDKEPPAIVIGEKDADGKIAVDAKDVVSDPDHVLVRYRLDDGAFGEWTSVSQLGAIAAGKAESISVESRDEEGNVGTATLDLIRGRAPSSGSGCGCDLAGANHTSPRGLGLLAIALGGVAARLARRRKSRSSARSTAVALGAVAALSIGASVSGCSCGSVESNNASDSSGGTTGGYTCTGKCVSLDPGLIGAYTSVAVTGKTVWVAGYAEANWPDTYSWGDLAVGKWNGKKVEWEAVDGVPGGKVDKKQFDIEGWRGGQTGSGDDVGVWTSIQLDDSNKPHVAYYDRTHTALKFARQDGDSWDVHTVESKTGADIGRYAKMLPLNGGWVIAYESIEAGGTNGALISKVRVATSKTSQPASKDWTFEDAVVSNTTPCRAQFCATGEACVASTKTCQKTNNPACAPACATTDACIDDGAGGGSCQAIFLKTKLDTYPDAVGDYIAIAGDHAGGIGIAHYDRPNGNLMIARKSNGAWISKVIDDGTDADGNKGDVGIGASLAIDAPGSWHVAYVDGLSEGLKYVHLKNDAIQGSVEIVDDGTSVDGKQFSDGIHLVGDDSSIDVTSGGTVRLSYQDSTAGVLRYATGAPNGTKHTWKLKSVDQDEFAGAFSHVIEVDGNVQIVNWWRTGGKPGAKGDVRVVDAP